MSDNTRLEFWDEQWLKSEKYIYIIFYIGGFQIRFYFIAIKRQGSSGQNVLNVNLPVPGVSQWNGLLK